MRCRQARRLFGAFWDDEITQAEREWLDGHFAACARCRVEYETYARALESLATLPRVEPSPDLAERALARARRASTAPDRLPSPGVQWAPVAAAAVVLLVVATLVAPWVGPGGLVSDGERWAQTVEPGRTTTPDVAAPVAVETDLPATAPTAEPLAAMSDSLFDHSDDVEFILDPVTVRRGRPSMSRVPAPVQGEQAVISF